jgi:hypothetical protein
MKPCERFGFREKVGREWGEDNAGAIERGINHASPMERYKLQGRQIL